MGSEFINLQNVYKKVLFSGLSNKCELVIQNISFYVIQNYILNFHNHHSSSKYSYQIDQLMFVASSNISLTNHTQKTYYLDYL